MSKILVLKEEPQMRRLLQCRFRREGYEVDAAGDYDSALKRVARGFDLRVLGAGVPGAVAGTWSRFRAWSGLPVIVLSAPENVADMIALLRARADDFVEKPCAID